MDRLAGPCAPAYRRKLGSGVRGYREGQRVIAGAITPTGWSTACLCGVGSQDSAGMRHGWKAMDG